MSTLAFAALTNRRLAAEPGTSQHAAAPGITPYLDGMAAMVPAEVLAAHAAIVGFLSRQVRAGNSHSATELTHPADIRVAFYGLLAASAALYLAGRMRSDQKLRRSDWLRALVPPIAFFTWTVLQAHTALDAVAPGFQAPGRVAIGIVLAVFVFLFASALGFKADAASPESAAKPAAGERVPAGKH